MEQFVVAGNTDEVAAFGSRNKQLVDTMNVLETALNAVFAREWDGGSAADVVIFYLGRRCVDDFLEILLLCANGYAAGASALLRGLYERAVTAAYLHEEPDRAADFMDYDFVQRRKLGAALRRLPIDIDVPDAEWAELEANYQAVKDKFAVTACKKCGTTRANHSWCKLDVVSMAERVGYGDLALPAYYMPLSHAHSTLASISAALQEQNGSLTMRDKPDYHGIDWNLRIAHTVLLKVLETQVQHFGLEGVSEQMEAAAEAYRSVWPDQAVAG